MIEHDMFIEYPEAFDRSHRAEDPSPIFRRVFELEPGFRRAVVTVCALGIGYYYLNGELMSEDLFTAPVSDYRKTLWTNEYDVTDKLRVGRNVFGVILGNGLYNESIQTIWGTSTASWRDLPKFALQLRVEYETKVLYVNSDENWLCSKDSPVRYHQLRSGETVDFRVNKDWYKSDFRPENWVHARISENAPSGIFRKCECQPIRMVKEYRPVNIFKNAAGRWMIDFGQTLSGFIRVRLQRPKGSMITIRHTERIKEDGTCNFNGMSGAPFYLDSEFQTDRFIFSGEVDEWHPLFTYHGFRYAEIEGMDEKPAADAFTAMFVHQAVDELSDFECSDEVINRLYSAGKFSSLSNMFYSITDCPTREKAGWLNDAQASSEQMIQNFDMYLLYKKWMQDIYDSMIGQGEIPGIVPTYGWGYEWGTGPISTGVLYEVPYRLYRYCGKEDVIKEAYPYMLTHLRYLISKRNQKDGLIGFGLCDWAGPFTPENPMPTPLSFTDTLLTVKFCRITSLAAQITGDADTIGEIKKYETELTEAFYRTYVDENGRCKVCEQTALSMMIVLGLYKDIEPLKEQLCSAIKKYNDHLYCGMLGTQYLFKALNICGLPEYAYRVITADGFPSYKEWVKDGATTLYERWDRQESNNHHMYSCVLAWFTSTIAGLNLDDDVNAFRKAVIAPHFLTGIDYCKASYRTVSGQFRIDWRRQPTGEVVVAADVPQGVEARLELVGYTVNGAGSMVLKPGENTVVCRME